MNSPTIPGAATLAATVQRLAALLNLQAAILRGAIIPSDLINMISGKIEEDKSLACLFEADYATFLNDLIDEVLEILLPDLQEVLYLDGIWFDDFESIEHKGKMLSDVCL